MVTQWSRNGHAIVTQSVFFHYAAQATIHAGIDDGVEVVIIVMMVRYDGDAENGACR